MSYIPFHEVLKTLNINQGDILWVASDVVRLLRTMKINGDSCNLNYVIDSLQDIVGNEGTLLFPTFNWDFCQGLPFDYHKTPSMTGSLSRTALQRKDFKRTKHPIYSFAVWGKFQDYLYSLENADSFGSGSPFEFVHKQYGKNLIIGFKSLQGNFTFLHYAEQLVGVPYRYSKNFTSLYIDEYSDCKERTYSMYVRNMEIENDGTTLGDVLDQKGIMKKTMANDLPPLLVDFYSAFNVIKDDIMNNRARKIAVYKGQ